MKPDFCRLRQRIAAWGFRPGLWLGLCLCLFCCSVLPARALELVDSRGVTVRLERPAQRIIALYGAFNEILLALDAREALVARTAADAAIPGLQDLPAVGTHMRPNAELVAARQPDVVLQLAGRQEVLTQTEALEAVGIPVLVYEMQSFEQLFAVTRALGRLTGRETRAEALVADWQRRLAVLAQRYAGQPPVRVFYEVRYPNLLAAGRASIVDEIIRHAGGRNVLDAPQKLVRRRLRRSVRITGVSVPCVPGACCWWTSICSPVPVPAPWRPPNDWPAGCMARSRAAGSEPGILLRGEGPFSQSSKGPSPLKLPPSSKSSFFWSVEGNGGALGVAVPSVSGRRGQGLIGAASSGDGDEERCIQSPGRGVQGGTCRSRTTGSRGERWAGFLRGRITDRYFFCRTVAASEGMNDGGGPCPHATVVGSVFPCGEMKESVCNRA